MSTTRYSTFPRTEAPPAWVAEFIRVFNLHAAAIGTEHLDKGLTSDEVLHELGSDLLSIGFQIETGKTRAGKIERPVFFGENGTPTVRYQVDGYHSDWRCGLEIEAGRAWMGNAVYRDLIQALVMVDVDWLCLAVPITYKSKTNHRVTVSKDYVNTCALADAVFGHTRVRLPYHLLLIGY